MVDLLKLFCIIALLSVWSCSKENIKADSDEVSSVYYSFEELVSVDESEAETKTTIDSDYNILWVPGDTVGIYPVNGSQIFFVVDTEGQASYATFDGGHWAFKSGGSYYCYYPFIGNFYLDKTQIPVSFTNQKQTGTTGVSHIGKHQYMYTVATSAVSGFLNFNLRHLCTVIRPTLTLPAGTYTKMAITAPTAVFTKKGYYDLTAGSCTITGTEYSTQIQIDLENITLTSQTTFYVFLMSAPVNVKGVEITVSVLNDQKKELQCKKTPGAVYAAGTIANITCNSWTEVPQSMGLIIENWDSGGSIGGKAN